MFKYRPCNSGGDHSADRTVAHGLLLRVLGSSRSSSAASRGRCGSVAAMPTACRADELDATMRPPA